MTSDPDTPPEAPALRALKRLFLPLMARAPDAELRVCSELSPDLMVIVDPAEPF